MATTAEPDKIFNIKSSDMDAEMEEEVIRLTNCAIEEFKEMESENDKLAKISGCSSADQT
jgi:hypothetical protein